jgi:hypothetical protein
MKTGVLIVACLTTLTLSCDGACAQDRNRVPDINQRVGAVDASVHTGVNDGALQEPQPSQEPIKLPTTYSRWTINFSGQPPATRYWAAHAKITTSAAPPGDGESPSTLNSPSFQAGPRPLASPVWSARSSDSRVNLVNDDSNSGKPDRQPGLFHNLDINRTQNSSTGPQSLKTILPSLSSQPQGDGYSTPFHEKHFGLTSDSSFLPPVFPGLTFSSQRDRATANRRKSHPKKRPDSKGTGDIGGFYSNTESASRSRPTTKAE